LTANGLGDAVWQASPSSLIPFVDAPIGKQYSVLPNTTATLSITGINFNPSSVVTIPGFTGTINSITIVSPTEIQIQVTSNAIIGDYDIVVSNGSAVNTLWAGNGVDFFSVSQTSGNGPAGTYTEGFESGLGNWIQSTAPDDSRDWTRQQNGTGSNGTGPNGAATGNFYMYTEVSSPAAAGDTFALETENFAQAQSISFDYHMFGAGMGTLEVQYFDGTVWQTLQTLTGQQQNNQGDAYLNSNIDLTGLSVAKLRFFLTYGSTFAGDAAIDNVVIISN